MPAGGGNFVPGESAFITTAKSPTGRQQVFMYDYDVDLLEQITDDPGDKRQAPDIWRGPEFGDELFFAVTRRFQDFRSARIYRENPDLAGNPTWTPYADIQSPNPDKPFIGSPRAFVHEGKSYITFKAMVSFQSNLNAEIWITDIKPNPALRFTRRISGDEPGLIRYDPEPFTVSQGPIVYYSEVTPAGINVIHRAATGL